MAAGAGAGRYQGVPRRAGAAAAARDGWEPPTGPHVTGGRCCDVRREDVRTVLRRERRGREDSAVTRGEYGRTVLRRERGREDGAAV